MSSRLQEGDEDARRRSRLFEFVRDITSGDLAEEVNLAGRERFLSGLLRARSRGFRAIALAGAAVLATGAIMSHRLTGSGSTSTSIADGSEVPGNGYVSVGAGAAPFVTLEGGARVAFAAGSRGRIGDPRSARVVLEGGHATVQAGSQSEKEVLVEAGPYALQSGNGAFDVSWSGSVFEVRVASGAVMLEGPLANSGFTLHEDQSFVAEEGNGESRCF